MDHGLSGRLTNTMFFLAPEPHIIVITGLCQSPGALRTDIGGQMDTGGAAGDTRLLPLISARMPLFIVASSDTFLQTRTWMSENTFPKALIGHTPVHGDGLGSHKLLKTNIKVRKSVVITKITKIKKAKNND